MINASFKDKKELKKMECKKQSDKNLYLLKVKNELNISDEIWNNSSEEEIKMFKLLWAELGDYKNRIIYERKAKMLSKIKITEERNNFWNNKDISKRIEEDINSEMKHLSYSKIIKLIEKEKSKQIEENKDRKRRDDQFKNREAEKEKIRLEEEKKLLRENEIKKESEKKENEKLIELEKQKEIENKLLERDKRIKDNLKKDLLQKEHLKRIESEAIQELIDDGHISENFSLKHEREPIPSHIKLAVWKRDKQKCVYCNNNNKLEFDHIIPVSKGGSNSINNIQLLCFDCNRSKSSKIE
jgi:hypothetical protein